MYFLQTFNRQVENIYQSMKLCEVWNMDITQACCRLSFMKRSAREFQMTRSTGRFVFFFFNPNRCGVPRFVFFPFFLDTHSSSKWPGHPADLCFSSHLPSVFFNFLSLSFNTINHSRIKTHSKIWNPNNPVNGQIWVFLLGKITCFPPNVPQNVFWYDGMTFI